MLRPLTGAILAMVVLAACESASPAPSTGGAGPDVVARWVADDGTVVALNVVLAATTHPRDVPPLARALRDRYPAVTRVIVTVFSAAAGPERFEIGHVPVDGSALPAGPRPATVIAVFDFPAGGATTGAP